MGRKEQNWQTSWRKKGRFFEDTMLSDLWPVLSRNSAGCYSESFFVLPAPKSQCGDVLIINVWPIVKVNLRFVTWLITSFLQVLLLLPLSLAGDSALFFSRAFSVQKSLLYLCLALGHLIFFIKPITITYLYTVSSNILQHFLILSK